LVPACRERRSRPRRPLLPLPFQQSAADRQVRTHQGAGHVGRALNRYLDAYPNVGVQTRAQFEQSQQANVNRELGLVYVLLALAVVIALFGAVIGVIIGTALGVAFAASLKQQGITEIAIPFASLVGFLVLSALLGLGAASRPARRAAPPNSTSWPPSQPSDTETLNPCPLSVGLCNGW
jgi:hypothetical protein